MGPKTCIHFRGIQHETCAAGVRMLDVRDSSGKGPYRWPCLPPYKPGDTCSTTCDKKRLPTADKLAADEADWQKALIAIEAGKSPCCGTDLDVSRVDKHGTGPRFCSACKAFVFRGCNRTGEHLEPGKDGAT